MTEDESSASILRQGLEQLKIGMDAEARQKLLDFGRLVLKENQSTNLVGRATLKELVVKDLLDSLAPFGQTPPPSPLIDVGSGAGFPGVPLAIAFPGVQTTLLEPRTKRAAFLQTAIEQLKISNCSVVKKTAQGAALLPARYACCAVRALGAADVSVAVCCPLLQGGGMLVLYRGRDTEPTPTQVRIALHAGLDFIEAREVFVPYLIGVRHVWRFTKQLPIRPAHPKRGRV